MTTNEKEEQKAGEPIVVQATNPSDQPATVQGSFKIYDVESKGAPTAPGFTRPLGVFVSKESGRALPALLTSQEERTTLLQGLQRGRKGYMYQVDSDLLMRVVLDAQAAHSSVPVEGILSPRQQKGFRSLLLRIASWTNARFDQHLRAEIGDEDADAVLRFLGKLCVLPPECDPSGRLMGTKVPVLKPFAVREGAPASVDSVGFLRARAPREDLAIEGLAPEAVDVGRAAYEAVSAASDEAFQELLRQRQQQTELAEPTTLDELLKVPSHSSHFPSTRRLAALVMKEVEKLVADVRRLEEHLGLRAEKESP